MDKNAALEAAVEKRPARQRRNRAWNWRGLLLPLLAIVTALIIGALVIVFTDESVYAAFREGVGRGFVQAFAVIGRAYGAFFTGAFGNPVQIVSALASGTRSRSHARSIRSRRHCALPPPISSPVWPWLWVFREGCSTLGRRDSTLSPVC